MNRAGWWTLTAALSVAFLVFVPMLASASEPGRAFTARSGDVPMSEIVAQATAAEIECSDGTYGTETTCNVEGVSVGALVWPDGVRADYDQSGGATHTIGAVGDVEVLAVSSDGVTLASTTVSIVPDIELTCEDRDVRPVYELVASDTWDRGWDYVYLDADGNRIEPGDDGYPADPGLTDLEPVIIGEGPRTGLCSVTSAAKDDLGGHITWHQEVPFDDPVDLRISTFTPFNQSHWLGAQPGELTATVHVDGVQASERRGVYSSGCT